MRTLIRRIQEMSTVDQAMLWGTLTILFAVHLGRKMGAGGDLIGILLAAIVVVLGALATLGLFAKWQSETACQHESDPA